ncbi:T-box transcription factor TBX21 isoform X1 [Paramormyrops kingsleyae]|uniref:T-box transcription factor 21 n=1 Tax=Paramormyrops kingsleyae TaxID=1676925 RepID=A0A3B3R6Z1_9TELE|nr:T-box transcription factor TBX21 isoform X1 [Paramormyrops kingsleyae]
MGGIGGNFYPSMLNGTETQSFEKDADINNHVYRTKDLTDLKMGIQDTRFYYQDPIQNSPDNLPLPYHAGQAVAGFEAQTGRYYPHTPLTSCPFNTMRSQGRNGPGQGCAPAGGDGFATTAKDVYQAGGESYTSPFQHPYPRPALYPLPGLQVCGKTQALLNNFPLWAKFHKYQTEMIITKQGRRMFPYLSFNISSLDPSAHYNVYVDVVLADQHHWRYQGGKWVQCGKAEGNMPGNRMYMHPDSPNTGAHWMRQEVSFGKLKLTNNKGSSNNVAQMIVLQSLHKYQPRLHIVEVKEDGSDDPFVTSKTLTFVFPETQFIAVTAYQNADITQLKIDHNPFAKGFRDNYDALYAPPDTERLTPSPSESQQLLPGSCYHQPYLPDQYMGALPQSRFFNRERMTIGQQPKDASNGPHSHWYLPSQQGTGSSRLDFNSYEGDYSGSGFYKPFSLQGPAHSHLGYYPDHPFTSGSISTATPGVWNTGRPSPQYLNHSLPSKPTPGLGWYCPMPSSSSDHRLHTPSLLEPPLPPPLLQDKPKEPGDDAWLEPASVKSVDSADSGLYESMESKKRRVSPYASSTESSPPNRNTESNEKDNSSDAGYYGFYNN